MKNSNLILCALLSLSATHAFANEPSTDSVKLHASLQVALNTHHFGYQDRVQCGDIITQSIRLKHDLNCSGETGFALAVMGDNIHIRGEGHTIYAPNAVAGIFVQGKNVAVTGVRVKGVANGDGIFAYDSANLRIARSQFSSNDTGILLYSENVAMEKPLIIHNRSTQNSEFGIRTGQAQTGSIVDPKIEVNDFSDSGSYAIYIQATHAILDYTQSNNLLCRSQGGYYLKDGTFDVRGFSFQGQDIQKSVIFVDSAKSIKLENIDASTGVAPNKSEEHVALTLYQTQSFKVKNLVTDGQDVGVYISTENGIATEGSIRHSSFKLNTSAGIKIESLDGTQFQGIKLRRNDFAEKAPALNIQNSANAPLTER